MDIKEKLHELKASLPPQVKLVAVSKFHPVERLMEAYNAGQRLFGENRPQELAAKVPQMPADVQWHFIGHLQTNKLKLVLPYVSMVESVDSLRLLEAIDTWAAANNRTVPILLELHLGAEETKHGFSEEEIFEILRARAVPSVSLGPAVLIPPKQAWAPEGLGFGAPENLSIFGVDQPRAAKSTEGTALPSLKNIEVRGLMGMATNTDDEAVVEADFTRIEALFNRIREEFPELRDTFTELSIGMSGDWPLAVRHGATIVRIGTDIFGEREY
ncbi:MAG: YggS family pyridoxal phosphate enzyme [Bacteroidales bacterium]|nr:YggS family pyridoxal phosphate enzyme [Bacteroidales bacterium]